LFKQNLPTFHVSFKKEFSYFYTDFFFVNLLAPPKRPGHFSSKEELKKYLQKVLTKIFFKNILFFK
jgi:hypothetical protein